MKNNSNKKWVIIIGVLLICAVLVGLITEQFKTPPVEDVDIPNLSSGASDVIVDSSEVDIKVPPIETPESEPPTTNGDDEGTEQTIQPDPVKPKEPTESQLKDKTQTPDGEKVDLPKSPDEEKEQEKNPPVDDTPKGGDINDSGQIFLPGFGWIDDDGLV